MNIDRACRLVIASSYLYYRHASPVLPDGEYDKLALRLVEEWDELAPFRQWQLENRTAISASGSHVKVTYLAEAGACAWHRQVLKQEPNGFGITHWNFSREHGVHWAAAEG